MVRRYCSSKNHRRSSTPFVWVGMLFLGSGVWGQTLEERLLQRDPALLAKAAQENGDAQRGAVLFHQIHLTCTQCHGINGTGGLLAPDLTKPADDWKPVDVIDSILRPSAKIRKGYETVVVITTQGRAVTGLLAEESPHKLVLRDAAMPGETIELSLDDVDERKSSPNSIMPSGLVNQIGSEEQFFDLAKYVMEIGEGGTDRAIALEPDPSTYALPPLPEYEKQIDHAGLIRDLNDEARKRGEKIYSRVCANCHGTHNEPGSLPTSLRFALGTFKNGSDPYRMYQTLTHGFGMMVAQRWMVPTQKYDVIHYIREEFLSKANPSQYASITEDYLAGLPAGRERGPKPLSLEPWTTMDYGQSLSTTIEVGTEGVNIAHKGIAIRLDSGPGGVARGHEWVVYDHDTMRLAGHWTGEDFIDWRGILFDGAHGVHPHAAGTVVLSNPTGPGWADPKTGSFDDRRVLGRDGRQYGPLPHDWAKYLGMYVHGDRRVLHYTIGETLVQESPTLGESTSGTVLCRELQIAPRASRMSLVVGRVPAESLLRRLPGGDSVSETVVIESQDGNRLAAGVVGSASGVSWSLSGDWQIHLTLEPSRLEDEITIWTKCVAHEEEARAVAASMLARPQESLERFTRGGPARWTERVQRTIESRCDTGPFVVESLGWPDPNPWNARFRPTGFDFFEDGRRVAVCTWDGDVWTAEGIDEAVGGKLTWQRIASGMFQPLGLKIVDGDIYVSCRDQICIVRDINGDGETDFYDCFNSDHQVTEHFHEFAMGLQRDKDGNFYYAKSACHAKEAVVPQHGTLLRVSRDGSQTTILARGFRAANGVCVNPDGSFIVTDQEGHWTPKNRINWIQKDGGFYGNMMAYHDVTDPSDAAMEQPLCWITNAFDRSPAELLWLDHDAWGPLRGSLVNLSYGYGRVYIVPHETVKGQKQGGMVALPIPDFPTGIVRGRIHPDGELYLCGMFAWAGSRQEPGGFFRMRYTGKPVCIPIGLQATRNGLVLRFSGTLDATRTSDPANFGIDAWTIKRTAAYGSDHFNQHPIEVSSVDVSDDGHEVMLTVPEIAPSRCMEVRYQVWTENGEPVRGKIHNTIHTLGPSTFERDPSVTD